MGGLWFKASLDKKFVKPHLNQDEQWWYVCIFKQDTISKITSAKRTGGVEWLQ
jgi:hypothetical protein